MNNTRFQATIISFVVLQTIVILALWLNISSLDEKYSLQNSVENGSQDFQPSTVKDSLPINSEIAAILRMIVRQEIADALARLDLNASLAKETQDNSSIEQDESLSYQQMQISEAAFNESRSIIDNAIEIGTWTAEDNQNLYQHLPDLSKQHRLQLLEQFHTAFNQQRLKVDPRNFPML